MVRSASSRVSNNEAPGHPPSHPAEYFAACQGRAGRSQKQSGLKKEASAENELTIKGKAYIAGIYEHPTRNAPDKSTSQLHAEVAKGVLEDAGLTKADIDGYFCAGDAPGGVMPMADYLGLDMKKLRQIDSTDTGGCSYLIHLGHAAQAIAAGKC
jgi:acetyl-CoA C-acetyltransferase